MFSYNLGAHIHYLGPAHLTSASGNFSAQMLDDVFESDELILPADISASAFYITNAYNSYLGNAASGGWSGYAFPGLKNPLKSSISAPIRPRDRNNLLFKGNSAHSTAYWWQQAGGVYVGGTLRHNITRDNTSPLVYNPGRDLDNLRRPCVVYFNPDANETCPQRAWPKFEDTKIFLTNGRGFQHWGSDSEVLRLETHDCFSSTNVFGTVWVNDLLVECRSNHRPTYFQGCRTNSTTTCNIRDTSFWAGFRGFQWYDSLQTHIVTNVK